MSNLGVNKVICLVFALLLASVIKFDISRGVTSNTQINAQVCSSGINNPSTNLMQVFDGYATNNSELNIEIATNWLDKLSITRDGLVVYNKTWPNQTADILKPTLDLKPGDNNFKIDYTGGCPESSNTTSFRVAYSPDVTTINPVNTPERSPELTGSVTNKTAEVHLNIAGKDYLAKNNGDGTWTLGKGSIVPALDEGKYDVRVWAQDASGVILTDETFKAAVVIDWTKPTGSVVYVDSTSRSPKIEGKVDDPTAVIIIEINGHKYQGINNGDGTWILPEGTVNNLASGNYELIITYRDAAGNETVIKKTISIKAKNEVAFVLPPNTGYFRVGQVNIYIKYVYMGILLAIGSILLFFGYRNSKKLNK